MNSQEATSLGSEASDLIQAGRFAETHHRLAPILAARTPFALLDRIGAPIGRGESQLVNEFLE